MKNEGGTVPVAGVYPWELAMSLQTARGRGRGVFVSMSRWQAMTHPHLAHR